MAIRSLSTSSISTGAKRSKFWDQSAVPLVPTAFDSIATYTPNGTGTVTFSSIPSTYKHLQIRTNIFQTTGADIFVKVNSTAGPGNHYMQSVGTTTPSAGRDTTPGSNGPYFGSTGASADYPHIGIIDVLDYNDTDKFKTLRHMGTNENNTTNSSGRVWAYSYLYDTTAAVTSITFYSANSFTSGSVFALYGIKG